MIKRRLKTLIALAFVVMMCATLVSSQVARKAAARGSTACDTCHTAQSLTEATSKYFEHYKTVHREAFRRKIACSTCHGPFMNEVKGRVKSASCAACHDQSYRARRLDAGTVHPIHLRAAGVTCSSCHQAVEHRIDMLQLLNVCSNCH